MDYIKQINVGGTAYDIKAAADASGNIIESSYLKLSGGTMTGQLSKAGVSKIWCNGRDGALVRMTSINGYSPTTSSKTANGSWEYGVWNNNTAYFTYITDSNYSSNTNAITKQYALLPDGDSSWALRNISYGTGGPSGGTAGDVYIQYF